MEGIYYDEFTGSPDNKGFKSIRTLTDFELQPLNIFIGANGAGKSNLLDFFRLLRNIVDGNLNDYIRNSGGISDLLFNGRKVTPRMEFEARFGPRGYRFQLEPSPLETAALTGEARYYQHGATGWWELGDSPDGKSLLVKEIESKSKESQYSRPVYNAIASWQIYHFHDTSANAPMRHYEIVQDHQQLRYNAANLAPYLLRLRTQAPAAYQEILAAIRLVMPFFNDFLLMIEEFGEKRMVNLAWQQVGSDYPMQPYHLSDGSIRFICLATALLQPQPPSAIIIDEPELGLHPYAIEILAELLQTTATRTQVVVATQSPALVDHFRPEQIVVVNREQGASTFKRLDADNLAAWLQDYSLGELWRKNVIAGGPVHE
ncbi:MAG: AAA family ATPase [Caldilineaceae bacterium]